MNIGIDLGTCQSCVGVYAQNLVSIIPNEEGNRSTPCIVSFTDDDLLVGDAAKQMFTRNIQNSVQNIKNMPIDGTVNVMYKEEDKTFSTLELTSFVIGKMKSVYEQYSGKSAVAAVISIPSSSSQEQQQLVREAATKAGLEVLSLLEDSIAAAIAYGFDLPEKSGRQVLVLNIGAKRSDATVISVQQGLLAVVNRTSCAIGGDNFDEKVVEYCKQEFKRKYKISLDDHKKAIMKLRQASDKSKIVLSNSQSTVISCESLYDGMDFSVQLSRARFEALNNDLFQACSVQLIQQAIPDVSSVTDVILAGGGCSIPKIQQFIQDLFPTQTIHKSIIPEEVITHGCAIEASNIAENKGTTPEPKQIAVLPAALNVQTETGVATLFAKNTPLPASVTLEVADESVLRLLVDNAKVAETKVKGTVTVSVNEQGQVKVV